MGTEELVQEMKESSRKRLKDRGIDTPENIPEGQEKIREKLKDDDKGQDDIKPPDEPRNGFIKETIILKDWVIIPLVGRVCAAEANFWYPARITASKCGQITGSYSPFITNKSDAWVFIKFYTDYSTRKFAYFGNPEKFNNGTWSRFLNGVGGCTNVQPFVVDGKTICYYFESTISTITGDIFRSPQNYNTLEMGITRAADGGMNFPRSFGLIVPRYQWNLDKFKGFDGPGGGPDGPGGPYDQLPPYDDDTPFDDFRNTENLDLPPIDDFGNPPPYNDEPPFNDDQYDYEGPGSDEDLLNVDSGLESPLDDTGISEDMTSKSPTSEISITLEGIHDIRVGDHIRYSADPLGRRFIVSSVEHTYNAGKMETIVRGSVTGSISNLTTNINAIINYISNTR